MRLHHCYKIWRARFRRMQRIMFPSPAEVRLIQIMGGRVIVSNRIKHWRTKFPAAIVLSLGRTLREEKFKREVRVGKYFLDFANDVGVGIEVDGEAYHRDVVAQFDRDSYLYSRGWRVYHVPALKLFNSPNDAQRAILEHLYKEHKM